MVSNRWTIFKHNHQKQAAIVARYFKRDAKQTWRVLFQHETFSIKMLVFQKHKAAAVF